MLIKSKKIRLALYSLIALISSMFYRPLLCSFDPIERARQIALAAKLAICLPYNLAKLYVFLDSPELKAHKQAQFALTQQPFPSAIETYQKLNADEDKPFLMSIGISKSQIATTENIIHPEYLKKLLQKKSQANKDPKKWLADHNGYVSRANSETKPFSLNDEQKLIEQLKILGVHTQLAAASMPSYRFSLEIADFINKDGSIVPEKLQQQANFLKELGCPLTIFHHYANPIAKPHLFEHKEDILWFAHTCAQVIKACPELTYVCPISQIMGFGLQVSQQKMLPPFSCNIDTNQFLQNIVAAQVAASKAMKQITPNLKVLVSHQWKPMKPMHSLGDPRHALECAICTIADRMYNQKFIQLLHNHTDSFDGIALSIYPALYFDIITPCGNNCTGKLDPQAALEAIVEVHKAFPNKEIHIIETGCNSNDPNIKKQFVDMTLYVCKLARSLGIPVKSCYFWGHINNPYFEWNKNQGTSFFGPFETLEENSINEYGKYLQTILQQK